MNFMYLYIYIHKHVILQLTKINILRKFFTNNIHL